jgi:hypothetical protein
LLPKLFRNCPKCLENVWNYKKIWCPEFFEIQNLSRHEKIQDKFQIDKTGQILDTKNPGHILDNLWIKKTGQILVVRREKIPGKFWTIKNQKM